MLTVITGGCILYSNNVYFHPFEYSTCITIGVVFVVGTVVGFIFFIKQEPKHQKTRRLNQIKNKSSYVT